MLKGGDWIASEYIQPRIGSDLALFKGIAKALIAAVCIDHHSSPRIPPWLRQESAHARSFRRHFKLAAVRRDGADLDIDRAWRLLGVRGQMLSRQPCAKEM